MAVVDGHPPRLSVNLADNGSSDDVVVLPPLAADTLFSDAVDEAIAGEVEGLPDLQPERAVGGGPQDFASLYVRHRSSFELHARRFLRDSRDVDEVVQETFLKLFLAMPELETELNALRFARRVMTNLCIDRYRSDQRRPQLIDLCEDSVDLFADDCALEDPVVAAEDAAVVRQALALLSPLHRAALIKREIEEKPLATIAAELDIPLESTKHVLHRARRALRRLLVGTSADPDAARRGLAVAVRCLLVMVAVLAGSVPFLGRGTPKHAFTAMPSASGPELFPHASGPANPSGVASAGHRARRSTQPASRTDRSQSPPSTSSPQDPVESVPAGGGQPVNVPSEQPTVSPSPATSPPASSVPASSLGPFSVVDSGVSAPAYVSQQSRYARNDGTLVSNSSLSATSNNGAYAVAQQLTWSSNMSNATVELSITAPTSASSTTYTVTNLQVAVNQQPDGTYAFQLTATATPTSNSTAGSGPSSVTVDLQLVYASDLTRVEQETVSLQPASISSATTRTPTPSVPNA